MASIRLVSHASVQVGVNGIHILSDPWQFGKAFNDSWSLLVDPDQLELSRAPIDYLWISHEHPDHFHIPTLRSLPDEFKKRVTVLFQDSYSDKMIAAFKNLLGFPKVVVLPHRRFIDLGNDVTVYCYHSRQVDSALAIRGGGQTILNLNDCEMTELDLANLKRDLGRPDVVLNQFSIAGFDGVEERLGEAASSVLSNYARDTAALGARYTIPFASFVYFSCSDNRFLNRHINTPRQAVDALARQGFDSIVLRPGDAWEIGAPWDNAAALQFYDQALGSLDCRTYDIAPPVSFEALAASFAGLFAQLHDKYSPMLLRRLKPVIADIPDIGEKILFDIATGRFERAPATAAADLTVNSQPLNFAFSEPFGVQTLGVSGRYHLLNNRANWMRHRVIFALNNAEIYLKGRYVLDRRLLAYFWSRRGGLLQQVIYRLQRMRRGTATARLTARSSKSPGD